METRSPSSRDPSGKSYENWNIYDDYFVDYKKLMNDEVKFIETPKSSYILKAKPATLACKVLNAKRIRFACNSKWIDETRHEIESGQDSVSHLPYLYATVQIQRQELDARVADLGEFACQCYASSSTASTNPENMDENIGFLSPIGAKGFQRSETAKIRLAYIRKHFHQMPMSQRVAEGNTIQLPCMPPDADPKPDIVWRKNEEIIEGLGEDSNLILANDGSLIISATRLSDSGNYTCEAINLANRRVTDTAQITVYVDGQWSPWTEWQGMCPSSSSTTNPDGPPSTIAAAECAVLSSEIAMLRGSAPQDIIRIMPKQRRQRLCNNPAPLNGGSQCSGSDEEFRMCPHPCVLNGAWAPWSRWSDCNLQCQRLRNRECTAPAPANGGTMCQGRDTESRNCSGLPEYPHCFHSSPLFPTQTSSSSISGPQFNANLPTMVGLGFVAILLLIIAALVGALVRRKSRWHKNSLSNETPSSLCKTYVALEQARDTVNCAFNGNSGICNNLFAQLIPPPPSQNGSINPNKFYTIVNNGGQHSLLRNSQNIGSLGSQRLPLRYMVENNYTLRSAKSCHSQGSGRKMSGSRAALITDYSSSNASSASHSGSGTTPHKFYKFGPQNDDSNYATLYDYVASTADCIEPSDSTNSTKYSTSLQTCTAVLEEDDDRNLEYGLDTRIYDGAASIDENFGSKKNKAGATIVAAQLDSNSSKVELKRSGVALTIGEGNDETWLSSVIVFGLCEQNTQIPALRRPVILSFEHCASLFPKDNWQFIVYANYDVKGLTNNWEEVCRLGEENLNTPVYAQLERQRCHLITDQFGRYLLAGKRRRPNVAPQKRVHLAAYCTLQAEGSKPVVKSIRVYCVPEMFMAVENIRRQEEDDSVNDNTESGICSKFSSGFLLAEAEGFLMRSQGALCCCLEEISEGYCLQTDSSQYLVK